jgi:hypothetical protein
MTSCRPEGQGQANKWIFYSDIFLPSISHRNNPLSLPGNQAPSNLTALEANNPMKSPLKYQQQPGNDTLSDFVNLVCQEAQNAQSQVRCIQRHKL